MKLKKLKKVAIKFQMYINDLVKHLLAVNYFC